LWQDSNRVGSPSKWPERRALSGRGIPDAFAKFSHEVGKEFDKNVQRSKIGAEIANKWDSMSPSERAAYNDPKFVNPEPRENFMNFRAGTTAEKEKTWSLMSDAEKREYTYEYKDYRGGRVPMDERKW
jgi:hypothetical protein